MSVILFDVRPLQDSNYVWRGVGQHARSLLQFGRSHLPGTRFVALTDSRMAQLDAEDATLFDEVRHTAYESGAEAPALVCFSPMTHSQLWLARPLQRIATLCATVVLDFIPLEEEHRYLANPAARLDYFNNLAWLPCYDHFFPISDHSSRRLDEVLQIPAERRTTTGVAIRGSLEPVPGSPPVPPRATIVVAGGGDERKNVEVALDAHAASETLAAAGISLTVIGGYPAEFERSLRQRHARAGGRGELLEFAKRLDDATLRDLYAGALLTVVPSRNEGFSIPVIEAAANGCPALASDCAAHRELVTEEDRFAVSDAAALRNRLEMLAFAPEARDQMRRRQAGLDKRFSVEAVGARFWTQLSRLLADRAPPVSRRRRPAIAVLTPLPPARTGVADYTYATLGPLAERADVSVFTGTVAPVLPKQVTMAGPPAATALLDKRFDAVVSVIGNSDFHLREFDLLLRYGSACIAHDARMLGFYYILQGPARACAAASAELRRPVPESEVTEWLSNEGKTKALFLGEIAAASRPMIVHSPVTKRLVKERHGVDCPMLPFVPYRHFATEELDAPGRAAARRALGVAEDEIIVASFGMIDPVKCIADCVWAVEILRAWGIPARLVLVGTGGPHVKWLRPLARELGMTQAVTMYQGPVPDHMYRLWLAAADVCLQLRAYQLGGLSGALLDCISAAAPTVTTRHLAEVSDAPSYIFSVPDQISPVIVAERIGEIIDRGLHRERPLAERADVLTLRNFDRYAELLMQALGFE